MADLIAAEAVAEAAAVADLVGLTFAQTNAIVTGSSGTAYPNITCFTCNSKGHYSSKCPKQSQHLRRRKACNYCRCLRPRMPHQLTMVSPLPALRTGTI